MLPANDEYVYTTVSLTLGYSELILNYADDDDHVHKTVSFTHEYIQ